MDADTWRGKLGGLDQGVKGTAPFCREGPGSSLGGGGVPGRIPTPTSHQWPAGLCGQLWQHPHPVSAPPNREVHSRAPGRQAPLGGICGGHSVGRGALIEPDLLFLSQDLTGGAFEDNLRSLHLQEGRDFLHFS